MEDPRTCVPKRSFKQHFLLTGFVALLTLLIAGEHVRMLSNWHSDFETFYLVAQMLRHGDGPRLYDFSTQAAYQMRYVDPSRMVSDPDLVFVYPAATALIFLPLAWLTPAAAFAAWTAVSLGLLVASVRLLERHLDIPQDDRPIFAALFFVPVYVCLMEGQLSLFMLFLYALIFSALKQSRPFSAGVVVGLALVKFQLLLGFLALLLLRRRWKTLSGAAVGGGLVALVSVVVAGWQAVVRYPITIEQNRHRYFDAPQKMVSLRGMLVSAAGDHVPLWLVALISVGIVAAVVAARFDEDIEFSAAVLVSILVAYHAYFYDLTLLLIPAAVIASRIPVPSRLILSTGAMIVLVALPLFLGRLQLSGLVAFAIIAGGLWYARAHPAAAPAL